MKYLFFCGGPLDGQHIMQVRGSVAATFESNGARYQLERTFKWARGITVCCFKVAG